MVQLNVLAGKQAGTSWVARRFPVRIGRHLGSEFHTEEPGVWDRHVVLEFDHRNGFFLNAEPAAITTVNGKTAERVLLHNGDVIDLGGLRLQFWLAETRQRSLGLREVLTWTGIGLVSLGQVAAIYWLIK